MKKYCVIFISVIIILFISACHPDTPLEKARKETIAGCLKGGASKKICECFFDQLVKTYSEKGIETIFTRNIAPKDFPEQTLVAAKYCALQEYN